MSNLSYILGIDTSQSRGQLCLFEGEQLLENIIWEKSGSHSEKITQQYEFLLERYPALMSGLKAIYCVEGPGSFTGLRVGINFSKTLAFAQNIPIVTVNSLKALALLCNLSDKKIISTLDAQRNSVFLSLYTKSNQGLVNQIENQIVPIKQLDSLINEEFYSCGTGLNHYEKFLNPSFSKLILPQEKTLFCDLTKIIPMNENQKIFTSLMWKDVRPLYIRASSAEEKRAGLKS